MAMLLASISEVYTQDKSSQNKTRSLATAYLTLVFLTGFLTLVSINWLKKSSKDYFNSGIKPNKRSARGYVFAFLLRRALF